MFRTTASGCASTEQANKDHDGTPLPRGHNKVYNKGTRKRLNEKRKV
ncbi:hypothetical protein [Bradyrhizobium sp.]|nr:hypothetical protein [Bradyrhizobium sp.]MBV9484179.1 hypothetical protein [Acidobacteriota bacterium]MBV9982868.1 hypothetical protein [Bradyrhizobium sp.]